MNVFVPFKSPEKVAKCLDKRRLFKQIIEINWILTMDMSSPRAKHPAVQMWKDYSEFLCLYRDTLLAYREGCIEQMKKSSLAAERISPKFLDYEPLLIQHRRRLYTKDKQFYAQFSMYGESQINMYIIQEGKAFIKLLTENGTKSTVDITEEINEL